MKLKAILPLLFCGISTISFGQTASELFDLSVNSFSNGTARTSAMGGAFAALGSDASSMSINPAGLGMYKASDYTVTLSTQISSVESSSGSLNFKEKLTKVPVNNIALIYNDFNSDEGVLRGVTVGYSYNLLQNYGYNRYAEAPNGTVSRLDNWKNQLTASGLSPYDISSDNGNGVMTPYRITFPDEWGAVLAYNSGLIFGNEDKDRYYYTLGGLDGKGNLVYTLDAGDEVAPAQYTETLGRKADNNFSVGFNLSDKFWVGATMSAQSYEYQMTKVYSEYAAEGNKGDLSSYNFYESLNKKGTGFSFKTGITAAPAKGLKVALAVHAPTLYTIYEEYYAGTDAYYGSNFTPYNSYTPTNYDDYKIKTPTTLIAGISYVVGKFGIVSVDYDRTWYNRMKYKKMGQYGDLVNKTIEDTYQATDNFRVGAEGRLSPNFYLRAGYAYYGNPVKNTNSNLNSWENYSGGIGYRTGAFYLDLTYVNQSMLSSDKYYYQGYEADSPYTYQEKINRHNIMLQIGFRL